MSDKKPYLIWQITHGVEIGLENNYADKHIELVRSFIPEVYRNYIIPLSTNWSRIVEARQVLTWEIEKDLALSSIRKKCVEIACDLLWYRATKHNAKFDVFTLIHEVLESELDILTDKYGKNAKIVREGHSLGSQIMLDASFDSKYKSSGLITLGSPISKYSGMYVDWGKLPDGLEFWTNFYARRDLVCSTFKNHPSKEISEFVEDVRVSSFNPLNWPILKAHIMYWNHTEVCKKIAQRLVNCLQGIQ